MCHSHHHRARSDRSDRSERIERSDLRASDSEREQTASTLQTAAAEGRLAISELEERLATAWAALTRGELAGLTSDLRGREFRPRRTTPWFWPPALIWVLPAALWLISSVAWRVLGL